MNVGYLLHPATKRMMGTANEETTPCCQVSVSKFQTSVFTILEIHET